MAPYQMLKDQAELHPSLLQLEMVIEILWFFFWISNEKCCCLIKKYVIDCLDYNKVVDILVESGIDINMRDQSGKTALHVAIEAGELANQIIDHNKKQKKEEGRLQ